MALIPDESARVKRLRAYELELARKMAFDEKFHGTKNRQTELIRRSQHRSATGQDNMVAVDLRSK